MDAIMTNSFHIAFYAVGFVLCGTTLYYMRIQGRSDRLQSRYFLLLVAVLMCNIVSGIVCAFADPFARTSRRAAFLVQLFQFFYFLFHTGLAPVFYQYSLCVVGKYTGKRDRRLWPRFLPFVITELLVVVNPLTGWVYYYDTDYLFHRGWAELLIYLAAGYFIVLTSANLFGSWRSLNQRRRRALLYFILLTVVGVLIQFINIDIKSELVAEALACMGLMLSVELEEDRLDADTGFYNRKALRTDLDSFIHSRGRFFIICLKITNIEVIHRVTGSANIDILSDTLSEFLRSLVPAYQIYHPNPETFLLMVMDENRETAEALAGQACARFERPWTYCGAEFPLHAITMCAGFPDELRGAEDVFFLVDHDVPPAARHRLLLGGDLKFLVRRMDVENAIRRSVEERRFQVYYQPTYYPDGRLYGAEALARLNDEKLGFIPAEEFIPVAEELGLIEDIDDHVLREVCAFLRSGAPEQYGVGPITVNLSVVQCMRPGFVDHIRGIVDSYGIRHERINFEITESVAADDYRLLSDVIGRLKGSGFLFSMGDYGTGYSNMTAMFSLSFDLVKIDKSLLWNALESRQGRIILDSSIRMVRRMGRQILVEGVETREQLALLRELDADYLQGFYFSRPVPRDEFVELLRESAQESL